MFLAVTIAPVHAESSNITIENNIGFNTGNTFIFAYMGDNYVIRGNEPANMTVENFLWDKWGFSIVAFLSIILPKYGEEQ